MPAEKVAAAARCNQGRLTRLSQESREYNGSLCVWSRYRSAPGTDTNQPFPPRHSGNNFFGPNLAQKYILVYSRATWLIECKSDLFLLPPNTPMQTPLQNTFLEVSYLQADVILKWTCQASSSFWAKQEMAGCHIHISRSSVYNSNTQTNTLTTLQQCC